MPRSSPVWLVMFVACTAGPIDNDICTSSIGPGIIVTLTDGATGLTGVPGLVDAPDVDELTYGTVRDGDFLDSLRAGDRIADTLWTLYAARERTGIYEVLVQIDGFNDWTASSVEVTQGVCHVNAAGLEAVLTRTTP